MVELTRLGEALSGLHVGDRAWFTFSPHAPQPQCALRLAPLTAGGAQLLRQRTPKAPDLTVGFVSIGDDGLMRFYSPNAEGSVLSAMAGWVHGAIAQQPALARLRDAEVLRVQPDGTVAARHADPALWSGLASLPVPGSAAANAVLLRRLPPGAEAWFWFSAAGPGAAPVISVLSTREDPSGERFAERLKALRRRSDRAAAAAHGVVRRTGDGVTFISTAATSGWARGLRTLADSDAIFAQARLLEQHGGRLRVVDEGLDLSAQGAVLQSLQGDDSVWFWFSEQPAADQTLLLAADRDALKAAVDRRSGSRRGLRGKLRRHRGGWLEFQVRSVDTDFLPALGAWAARHVARWPVLAQLRGAHLLVRGQRETIQDDGAWSSLVQEIER